MKNAKKFTVTITSALLAVAALTSTAEATCGFSNPTESSSFAAGDQMPISWTDIDEEGAKCSELSLTIELRVGSRDVQSTVAVVADGVDGSTGGASYDIPKELSKTDDTYFLEMHDSAKGFQNFSARFSITGVSSGGDPSEPGNGTEPEPEPEPSESEDPDSKSGDDTPDGNDDTSDTTETDNQTNETDNNPTEGQNGDSGSNQPNSGANTGGASANSSDNTTATGADSEPAAASSWFVSFASLAIVTFTVSLSNMF